MAAVELTSAAVLDLDRLVSGLSLPADTRARVRVSLEPLTLFPRLGVALPGRWRPARFMLGPWRWMLLVYDYDEASDRVVVLAVHDARSSAAVTHS